MMRPMTMKQLSEARKVKPKAKPSGLAFKPVASTSGDPREERWGAADKRDATDDRYDNDRVAIVSPEYQGPFDPTQPHSVYFGFHDDSRSGHKIRISYAKKSKRYKTYKTAMRAVSNWILKRK